MGPCEYKCCDRRAAVVAVTVLLPLVRFVPVITEVDKTTGEVQVKQAVDKNTSIDAQDVMDKYFILSTFRTVKGMTVLTFKPATTL